MVSNPKKILKFLIPGFVVRKIRHVCIIKKQKKCQAELNWLAKSVSNQLLSEIKPLKKLDNQNNVWQYWGQGFDSSNMPDLIKVCLKSVEMHTSEYSLIRLSDENLNEYLEIPKWLENKMSLMSKAHFSDLLRCVILSLYGGVWFDAAIFMSGNIPQYIIKDDFFMYRRDELEKHKSYWENTFAYYFGYSPDFSVKSLIGIMYAKKGNTVVSDFATMLLTFWKNYDYPPDYFFFQIIIEEYFKKHPKSLPKIVNDTIPHLLRQYINEFPAPGYSISDIMIKTTRHSLNYKSSVSCRNLLQLFPEYEKHLN